MIWIIPGVILILLVIWLILTYNKLISERLKVDTQWHQIDVVLKQRSDLIPNLVKTTVAYMTHESELITSVTNARARYMAATEQADSAKATREMDSALHKLLAVSENYPELKANTNFLELQKELAEIEGRIADFRQFYNDTTMRYNRLLVTIPTNIVAKIFGFGTKEFIKIDAEDGNIPDIKFKS